MKKELFVEIKDNVASHCRKATPKEVSKCNPARNRLKLLRIQRERILAEIEKLEHGCTHPVIYDEAGWLYDSRICYRCGALVTMI